MKTFDIKKGSIKKKNINHTCGYDRKDASNRTKFETSDTHHAPLHDIGKISGIQFC